MYGIAGKVFRVRKCELHAAVMPWAFAIAHHGEVEANWQKRLCENPAFFNGTVHVLVAHEVLGDTFRARLNPVSFKEFLYWKDLGYPDPSVLDVFGSALIRSAEGHILLGRQRAGNLNAGLAYLPGGFIDERDVDESGKIDIAASVRRELVEETGLTVADVMESPGFIVTFWGAQVSIAVEICTHLTTEALVNRVSQSLAQDDNGELDHALVVRSVSELAYLPVPGYARLLLETVLSEP